MTIKYKVSEDRPFYKGKFWPKGVPHQLDYDYSLTVGRMLEETAAKYPDDPVMWFLDGWTSYKEFNDLVDRFATYLASIGVKKGDVVAVYLANCPQYVVCYYATVKIGAIITGINPTYQSLEVLHQFKLTKPKVLLALDALYFHYVTKIEKDYTFDKVIITNLVDQGTGLSGLKKWLGKLLKKIPSAKVEGPNKVQYLDCFGMEPNLPKVDINPEKDTATLIMTGGTTGVPKAAELSHENVVSNAIQCLQILVNQKPEGSTLPPLGHKTGMVGVLPLYHSFAMTTVMNTAIACGGWMMIFAKPPDTEELLETICDLPDYNGFIYCAAEILFQRVSQLPDEVLAKYPLAGRLRLSISGAGPLHEYVREPYEAKTGAKITEGYGLSEATPVVSCNNFYGEREPGYIGVPAPGTDWMIFDGVDFSKGPVNELGEEKGTGEICCTGPQVMKGYFENPEGTANNIKEYDGKRWLLTGDIGFMDEYGRIAIRDRKKQLIKMAGHSVFPKEVETLMGSHPKVLEVAVAGLPDPKTGEAVKAWVALMPEAVGTITADEIKAWTHENITKWKAPKYVEIIDEIPKSTVGKVMRRTLQEADPLFVKK
ncbi:MAG: AMP-binding protein [Promethearchaeota archaeon]